MSAKGLLVFTAVAILCMEACSIKEDRAACPCVLVLDLSKVDAALAQSADIDIVSSGGFVYNGKVLASDYPKPYYVEVPKESLTVDVSSGGEGYFRLESGFVVPKGMNYPPLYLYSANIDARSEQVESVVLMHKEHCNIDITMKAYEFYPFSVVVEGEVCGLGLDGKPVPGAYSYAPEISPDGLCSVRVPRQLSSSLVLSIIDENNVLRSFALGEYILESGYDWSAENLEDIEIEIDYYRTEVVFTVNDWVTTIHFDVEI